jgi:hypothetical protein
VLDAEGGGLKKRQEYLVVSREICIFAAHFSKMKADNENKFTTET